MITSPNVKVNLGLSVLHRREDGFHDLETLFLPYHEIHDTLEIVRGDEYFVHPQPSPEMEFVQAISPDGKLMVTILRKGGVDWEPLSDLTAKAYFLLAADFELPPMKIWLEKHSPVGAGLGGGSADAAFALRMMSEIAGLGLDDAQLAGYASRLGSDCAFFVYNRPMLGTGRGEILEPYDVDLSGLELKVIVPEGISVSTREAYGGIVPRDRMTARLVPLRDALSRTPSEWKDCLVNDFETTVFERHPELSSIKQSLYDAGAVYASMSGSGSSLFGLFKK